MEIKDFVKEALAQIVEGINEANKQMSEKGAFVASSNMREANGLPKSGTYVDDVRNVRHVVREIEFDVSIAASDSTQTGGRGGLQVVSFIRADGGIENNVSSSASQRIKFSLPLALPVVGDR